MQISKENTIKIAVKVNGGFGTVLVRANYLYCLKKYLNDCETEIYAYAHKIPEINDAIFRGSDVFTAYYEEEAFRSIKHKDFDLVFELDLYVRILYADEQKIKKSAKLKEILDTWYTFQNDEVNRLYYRELRQSKPYEYRKLIRNGKTVLNSADEGEILGIDTEYSMPIHIEGDEKLVLQSCGLKVGQRYITIQRGNNPKLATNESPKLWPVDHFEVLARIIKENHPEITIVQLGESTEHCKSFDGVDINLVGQTTWNDLKVLLKYAVLHIDSECGMVHLRKALHAGPSLVIFGPTPVKFFGYSGNINIKGNGCPDFCAELREDWEYRCIRGEKPAPCMTSVTPEMAYESIRSLLVEEKISVTDDNMGYKSSVTDELIKEFGDRIDKDYIEEYIKRETIYGYEKVNIPIKDLIATVYDGDEWLFVPLDMTPAYRYLQGDKDAYRENMKARESLENNIHSMERYENLITQLKGKSPEDVNFIIVKSNNVIADGQHRASYFLNSMGHDARIDVIRIYRL